MSKSEHAIEVDAVLKALLNGPKTRKQLGVTRYRMQKLIDDKLVKRAGEVKNRGSQGRKAVSYELLAKGRKRAAKL